MDKKSEEVYTVEVDAATKKRIELLLKQQKKIDTEAAKITEESQSLSYAIPETKNRNARRKVRRIELRLNKLSVKLEKLKAERMETAREMKSIQERWAVKCKE